MSKSSNVSASGNVGNRLSEVKDLKILKSPVEGGSKKDYQDFLDKIENHVTMAWDEGADIGQIVSSGELPDIDEPEDIIDEDEKSEEDGRETSIQHLAEQETVESEIESSSHVHGTAEDLRAIPQKVVNSLHNCPCTHGGRASCLISKLEVIQSE